ncbi:mCG5408, isoform CRA_b [Mus musculus]|nr:mCG5408, isoform CRA_b [Mus musculus]BAB30097.1 unnamed protein product [Mus musculus]
MEYHTKIRELILDGSSQLIQEGLRSGFLYPLVEKQHGSSRHITLPLDAYSLTELCEMAKHLPSLNEVELQTLQLIGGSKTFDAIVIDASWENKSAKRRNRSQIQESLCSHWILLTKSLMNVLYWRELKKKLL